MKLLISGFLAASLLLTTGFPALAVEYSVPHSGSPYQDLADLEDNQILHLPTGVLVSLPQMIEIVAPSRVIYVGETHDNIEAHRAQLEVIRQMSEQFPGKIAVAMEMFRQSAQPELERWHRGELTEKQFRKLFRRNWGPGYQLYQPIFDFMRTRNISLLGLKSSRETEQLLRDGGLHQTGLPEIDADDVHHKAYSMALFGGNDTHTDGVSKPYQMLLLWEEAMAETIARFLKDPAQSDKKLIVLTGGFHVQYGFGIPKRAFRRVPHTYSIILTVVTEIPEGLEDREMAMAPVSIPLYSADFGWKLKYRVPPPKRIRLGVYLEEREEGLRVTQVNKNSNGERMHLEIDDVILQLDGRTLLDVEDLSDQLQTRDFGDRVRVQILRGGVKMELQGLLEKTEAAR